VNIAIIGLGLIGGNIAKSIRKQAADYQIAAYDCNADALNWGLSNGIIDKACTNLEQLLQQLTTNSFLIICTPPLVVKQILPTIAKGLAKGVTVTDVISDKQQIIDLLESSGKQLQQCFVPSHPIAGSEKSGVKFAIENAFDDRNCIVTPFANNQQQHIDKVIAFWQLIGAKIVEMNAKEHDAIFALTSHLPHILAFNLLHQLFQKHREYPNLLQFAASGFQDFTRIGMSNETMWSQICCTNRAEIVAVLDQYIANLQKIKEMCLAEDHQKLEHFFKEAKEVRKIIN